MTAHDGFTLRDLVSYNEKHNEANGGFLAGYRPPNGDIWSNAIAAPNAGEQNRDGESHNNSWNCGAEGPSNDPGVSRLRERQMRNLMAALLTAQASTKRQRTAIPAPPAQVLALVAV